MNIQSILKSGLQELQSGNVNAAKSAFDQVLQEVPDQPMACMMGARIARHQGNLQQASNLLAAIGEQHRMHPQVLSESGYLAMSQANYLQAAEYFEHLVKINPSFADGHFNLGLASRHLRKFDVAADCFRKSLDLGISAPHEVWSELGSTLTVARHEDEAADAFDQALTLRPDWPQALFGAGVVKAAHGSFDEAEKLYRRALDTNPDYFEVYQQLAAIREFNDVDDADIERMTELLESDQLPLDGREKLNFALGKALNDAGAFETAWSHYQQANELKNQRSPEFDRDLHKATVEAIVETFTPEFCNADRHHQSLSNKPIIIFGMPRSGTSMVEQVISSHSTVTAGGELTYFEKLARTVVTPYPEQYPHMTDHDLREIADNYLHLLEQYSTENRVTDKYPANFLYLGVIATVFPKASLVHVKRDPADILLSIFTNDFPSGNYYSTSIDDIVFYYRCYQKLMRHWEMLFADRLYTADYENFVEDPEKEIGQLLEYCELPFEEQCLTPHEREGAVATLSRWQVRQPIYKSSKKRWRNYDFALADIADQLNEPLS